MCNPICIIKYTKQPAIMRDSFLDQVVTEPTKITETTSSTLELFLTTNQTLINKVEVVPGISDHEEVFIESSLKPLNFKIPARKAYQRAELLTLQIEFGSQADTMDVEQLWTLFKNKIHFLMNKYFLSKFLRGNKTQ